MMSKVHPHGAPPSPSSNSSSSTDSCLSPSTSFTRENYTIWMKSLILGGRGCTVYDSKGQVVYRVDNYSSKCCDKVFLMDCHGHVLLTIQRKKFSLLSQWEGYREERKKGASKLFQVQKSWGLTKKPLEVVANLNHDSESSSALIKIEKSKNELSSCRIVDRFGGLIAEVKRKQSAEGVVLGNDVLTMVVETNLDHSLIMGLMVSYSLINSRM